MTRSLFTLLCVALFLPACGDDGDTTTLVNVMPAPTVVSVIPAEAASGEVIQISGTAFGATQDTLTIGGMAATPTSWSNTSITAPVPAGANAHSLVVTVGGVQSNVWPLRLLWTASNPTNAAISTAVNSKRHCQLVSDAAGGAIIVWSDANLYAQRVDPTGAVLWTVNGVLITGATNTQERPQICTDGAGGAIIAWQDYRSGGVLVSDIYAQRINAAGVVQWTVNGVAIATAANAQSTCRLVPDGAGGAIITWQDNRGAAYDIYAQRIDGAGAVQWTANGVVISAATNDQISCAIASDGAGGAIVAWSDFRNGVDYDTYAQRVNAAGAAQWTPDGVAIAAATNFQSTPQVLEDGAGGAILAWQDSRNSTYSEIYAQRVNASGIGQWTANGIAIAPGTDDQIECRLVSDDAGGAIIAWDDFRSGTNSDIYAQRINGSGVAQWSPTGVAVSVAPGHQTDCRLAIDGSGGAIIVWQDLRGGATEDVYAQRLDAFGFPQWTLDGLGISTANLGQTEPAMVSDGAGGAIIGWQDLRSTTRLDIYAQGISGSGNQ